MSHTPTNNDRLIELLRSAIWSKDIEHNNFTALSDKDWSEMLQLASKHGVRAIVWQSIAQLPQDLLPHRSIKLQWAMGCDVITSRYNRQLETYNQIIATANELKCQLLLLKGLGLSALYPTPSLRECGDIDLLPIEGFNKGVEVMDRFTSVGDHEHPKHSSYIIDGVHIELHRKMLGDSTICKRVNSDLEHILATEGVASIALPSGEILHTPTPNLNAIFIARHTAVHSVSNGIALRQLCDWALFLTRYSSQIDQKIVVDALERAGSLKITKIITRAAIELLGMDSHHNIFGSLDDSFTTKNTKRFKAEATTSTPYKSQPIALSSPKSIIQRIALFQRQQWLNKIVNNETFVKKMTRTTSKFIIKNLKK